MCGPGLTHLLGLLEAEAVGDDFLASLPEKCTSTLNATAKRAIVKPIIANAFGFNLANQIAGTCVAAAVQNALAVVAAAVFRVASGGFSLAVCGQ